MDTGVKDHAPNQDNGEYLVKVGAGSPPPDFMKIIDMGLGVYKCTNF
jgi:hypothetical protein